MWFSSGGLGLGLLGLVLVSLSPQPTRGQAQRSAVEEVQSQRRPDGGVRAENNEISGDECGDDELRGSSSGPVPPACRFYSDTIDSCSQHCFIFHTTEESSCVRNSLSLHSERGALLKGVPSEGLVRPTSNVPLPVSTEGRRGKKHQPSSVRLLRSPMFLNIPTLR
ncbi:hypothetical protein F2P81_022945 [Scophthalmus maximus]|uniref:Uncharacterized protein n=1 Tax=Scophthalmus maximus TaxID=52904 RepID=A0A6A4RQ85_SCOMX|nr:hypothetical protein F2P81_022945 [Scophthalmus maximus]